MPFLWTGEFFGGSVAAGSDLDDFFSDDGATVPWYGNSVNPPALYDSGSDTSWFAWEGWNGSARVVETVGLDHATGYWSEIVAAGVSPLVDDDHGNPAICLDDDGHLWAFYGGHASDLLISSTRWAVTGAPGDGSMWAVRAPIAGDYSYPHPVVVGSTIYLFMRDDTTTTRRKIGLSTITPSAGVGTPSAPTEIVDFGASTWAYLGTAFKVGTDIHFVVTKADDGDTIREHVYYFVYKTATGAVENHNSSVSIASGSLPVDLAEANADFRLFAHSGGNGGSTPALCIDTSGDPHVLFSDGSGSSYALKHIKRTAGSWSSPVTVATLDAQFGSFAVVPLSGGRVEAWYGLDPGSLWGRDGNMTRRERSSASVWGGAQTILAAGPNALSRPAMVLNGHADARVVFCEVAEDDLDASAGGLRTYVYGAGGLIPYEAAPDGPISSSADGNELREDDSNELREDDTIELREIADA